MYVDETEEITMEKPFLVNLNVKTEPYTVVLTICRLVPGEEPDDPERFRTGEVAYVAHTATPEAAVHEAMRQIINNREMPPLMSVRLTCVIRGAAEVVPRSNIDADRVAASFDFGKDDADHGWYNSPAYEGIFSDD